MGQNTAAQRILPYWTDYTLRKPSRSPNAYIYVYDIPSVMKPERMVMNLTLIAANDTTTKPDETVIKRQGR